MVTLYYIQCGQETSIELLKKWIKFSTGFLRLKKVYRCTSVKNTIYQLTKWYGCFIGFSLTV